MVEKKILVADDSRNIVNLLKYNFSKKGYVVIEAFDGEQALQKALSEKPDIIILDINMPLKDGFDVCRTLRNTPQTFTVPIIILSARSKEFDKLTGFGLGADDYMTKPFKIEELIERADSLLAGNKIVKLTPKAVNETGEKPVNSSYVCLGEEKLDSLFKGKLYRGANILLTGPLGTGKSSICRKFMAMGLQQGESGFYIAVEDPPDLIMDRLNGMVAFMLQKFREDNMFRIASISGMKSGDYEEMLKTLTVAGEEIDQSIQKKKGGRRVIDSVSGLFASYDEDKVYHFLSMIVHTASSFGGVTTLYVLEEGTLTPQQSTTVKSLMDGVVELKNEQTGIFAKVLNMKWVDVSKDKVKLWNKV